MVLPLVIGGVVLVGALVLLTNSKIGEAINRTTKSDERKGLEIDIERYNHAKERRGFFNNAYAFVFGETALANTYGSTPKSDPAPIQPGEPHELAPQARFENFGTNRLNQKKKRATRYSDG